MSTQSRSAPARPAVSGRIPEPPIPWAAPEEFPPSFADFAEARSRCMATLRPVVGVRVPEAAVPPRADEGH